MDPASRTRLADALEREPAVRFAYLFGSQATGTTARTSDVDVAVHLREGAPPDADLELLAVAQRALRRRDVDLVVLGRAPLTLAFEALKGQLLFSKDEAERVTVEARIMTRYHDQVYYMRRHLAWVAERTAERGFG